MPDDIERAVKVFVDSLAENRTVKCDIIQAVSGKGGEVRRHFVGYGGVEIFGRIPHYTETRFIKYYKGVLGQLFGDKAPFLVGALLAILEKATKCIAQKKRAWKISVDGKKASRNLYQAMIIVNGYLGSELPFARSVPLGSGDFYLFAIKDLGLHMLPSQFKHAWDSSIVEQPERWGFESYRIEEVLKIEPDTDMPFPVNVDGSTMICKHGVSFRIVDQINLISKD
jgi:diacylglycerol kinase family enzyme